MDGQQVHRWYEQYSVGIFRFVLSILKDAAAAEDVLQEVFLRLLKGKYAPEPGKEQAYLYRAAQNLCYDEVLGSNRYTRWVHWVDEEKQVVFSIHESDYSDSDRVVECAKLIIDLNS